MSAPGEPAPAAPLAPEERDLLLRTARAAIVARLGGRHFELPESRGRLAEPRGAFVSLHERLGGELRGCVGRLRAETPLIETVARMAVAAAMEDQRFAPVTLAELPRLSLEVSALGPLTPIRPEQVEVGRHGLLIGDERHRGVLLPQVPVEHGWDRETFLDHTCLKAGLPLGAWRKPGIELEAFSAEVFGE